MLILSHRPRTEIVAAIDQAVMQSEAAAEVAILHRVTHKLSEFCEEFLTASITVLDMSTLPPSACLECLRRGLEQHPFAKVVCVSVALTRPDEQRVLFDLGRLGVAALPSVTEAATSAWWADFLGQYTGFDSLKQAHRELRRDLPDGPKATFILRLADHASAPSVKVLVARLYSDAHLSLSYKRRRLWEECKSVGFRGPEDVMSGIRLLLLKSLLDHRHWTLTRTARFFGMPTARHLARSCRTRYGTTLTGLRDMARDQVVSLTRTSFWSGCLVVCLLL